MKSLSASAIGASSVIWLMNTLMIYWRAFRTIADNTALYSTRRTGNSLIKYLMIRGAGRRAE